MTYGFSMREQQEQEHREEILEEVDAERTAQDAKWGEQNPPDATVPVLRNLSQIGRLAKHRLEVLNQADWASILMEEVGEVADAMLDKDQKHAREELVQCSAVIVAWIQAIDRRQGVPHYPVGDERNAELDEDA